MNLYVIQTFTPPLLLPEILAPDKAVVLLLDNGIYHGTAQAFPSGLNLEWKALNEHVIARGFQDKIDKRIELISYHEFVELTLTCHQVIPWR